MRTSQRWYEPNPTDEELELEALFETGTSGEDSGDLFPLPSMPLLSAPPPTPPTGPPTIATDELPRIPAEMEQLRIGDEVELPDGRKLKIQWIDPKKKRVGCGKRKGKNYVFFSFEEVQNLNGKQIATDLTKKRERENHDEGQQEKSPPVELPRDLPAGLFPWQVETAAFITEQQGRGLIASEMGLGKTASSIVVIDKPAVVVCPSLLKVNWVRELNRWRPDLDVALVEGSKEPDELVRNADVVVLNYAILHSHVDWLRARNNQTLIADEAHYLKNLDVRYNKVSRQYESTTKGPRRATAFYELQRDVPSLMFLTGTPILNRTKELFPLLHMLNPREWNSGYQFCIRYCAGHNEWIRARGGRTRQVFNCNGRSNTEELHQRISGAYMIRHTKAEVMKDMPPKTRRSVNVSLSTPYKKKYLKAARDFLAWVEEQGGPKAVARAQRAQALVKMTKLRALSASGKAEAAVGYITEYVESTGRPLVVMGVHKEAFALIEQGLVKANEAYHKAKDGGSLPEISKPIRYGKVVGGQPARVRQAAIDAFQDEGTLDVILYSIPIATGTTLTRAQDVVFLERIWRPADQVQAEDRLHRLGQKNAVTVTYLDAEGTIDLALGTLLMDKAVTAAQVIDGVDLSAEEASMLVFGEMFNLAEDFLSTLEMTLGDDASRVAGEAFDESDGIEENPGLSDDDATSDVEPSWRPNFELGSSWDDPL